MAIGRNGRRSRFSDRFGRKEESLAERPHSIQTTWHSMAKDAVIEELKTRKEGLTEQEASQRLQEHGPNILPAKKPPTVLEVFLRQFLSPLIYVLMAASLLSALIGDMKDAIFILIVLLINAVIGTIQEVKAEKSAERLQSLLKTASRTRREGVEVTIPAEQLVPGDIVLLESGARVPADIRLISLSNLTIDESLLTGESVPSSKHVEEVDAGVVVSERKNMAYAGSVVATGRATGVVVATGAQTEIGLIAETVSRTDDTKPPLLVRLEKFSKQISYLVLGASALLAIIAVMRGTSLIDVFFMAVALAVSAIPEGLPVAVTVALAIRVVRMSRRNVLTRRLAAVESLGSCTCIASDKTGTLTVNKQTVKTAWLPDCGWLSVTGEGYNGEGVVTAADGGPPPESCRPLIDGLARASVLCNEAFLVRSGEGWRHSGDAVDVALLAFGIKAGTDVEMLRGESKMIGDIPFESERMFAARFFSGDEGVEVAVKGAAEVVLGFCDSMLVDGHHAPLDRTGVEAAAAELSGNGYRVIAVASGRIGAERSSGFTADNVRDLSFVGLLGLIDPPRPDVKDAIAKCSSAGIMTVMITGDHPATAFSIAKELGIAGSWDEVVTGQQLLQLGSPDDPEFLRAVEGKRVFSRVTPIQKLDIVGALIKLGHFVAVTGDGVNDAPALRKANIGVAMGSGTDVAKDASSIIVTDDNFASIVSGVEEGRYAYENVRKVTYLLVSTGAGEIVLFLLAILSGIGDANGAPIFPLLAIQLLWLNVVTNGIQHVTLAMEAGDPKVMSRKPRSPSEGIFDKLMVRQVAVSAAVVGVIAFSVFYYLYEVSGLDAFKASNLTFLLMVFIENVHVFNCRSERDSAFKVPIRNNYALLAGVLGAQAIHLLAMNIPLMQDVLRVEPVSLVEYGSLLAVALTILVAMEIFKWVVRRRENGTGSI